MTEVVAALAPAPERPRPPPAAPRPPPARRAPVKPKAAFDAALAEVGAGHAHRARRLAEEAVRWSPPGPDVAARSTRSTRRCARAASSRRRCACDGRPSSPSRTRASASRRCGCSPPRRRTRASPSLAASWRLRRGRGPAAARRGRARARVAGRVLPGGAAAARARRAMIRRACWPCWRRRWRDTRAPTRRWRWPRSWWRASRAARSHRSRRLALLRAAHADEYEPARRARLGWRLAAQLEAVGDVIGAVAVLERALEESAPGEGARVRGERARLLRSLGRPRELAAALEKDAGALLGDARLPVLAEQADLLEAAGEAERALDVRMMALAEFPGAPAVLDDARARLEATGRPIESLALAIAALDHTDRSNAPAGAAARRRRPQRAAGRQREPRRRGERLAGGAGPGGDRSRGRRGGGAPAARGGRLGALRGSARVAGGARGGAPPRRAPTRGPTRSGCSGGSPSCGANVWAKRTRRCASTASSAALGPALPPLADPPELASLVRRDFALSVETTRAGVAPSAAERSRALVDRAALLLARGRGGDARARRAGRAGSRSAQHRRDGGARKDVRGRAAGPPAGRRAGPSRQRGCRRARRRRCSSGGAAPRSAPAIGRARARLTGGRCRWTRRWPSRSRRWARWRRARATGRRSRSCSRARWAWRPAATRKGPLLIELAVVYGDRLGDPARAVTLLENAARFLPDDPRLLDLGARFQLAAGNWQAAADALDRLAARGADHRGRGGTILRGARRRRGGRAARSRAHPVFAIVRARQRLPADAGTAVRDLLRARAVGQRLEGDGGAAGTPRRRAARPAIARRCSRARRSRTCTSASARRRPRA